MELSTGPDARNQAEQGIAMGERQMVGDHRGDLPVEEQDAGLEADDPALGHAPEEAAGSPFGLVLCAGQISSS